MQREIFMYAKRNLYIRVDTAWWKREISFWIHMHHMHMNHYLLDLDCSNLSLQDQIQLI